MLFVFQVVLGKGFFKQIVMEHSQQVGAGDYSDKPALFQYRQPADIVLDHGLLYPGQAGIGSDGDHLRRHESFDWSVSKAVVHGFVHVGAGNDTRQTAFLHDRKPLKIEAGGDLLGLPYCCLYIHRFDWRSHYFRSDENRFDLVVEHFQKLLLYLFYGVAAVLDYSGCRGGVTAAAEGVQYLSDVDRFALAAADHVDTVSHPDHREHHAQVLDVFQLVGKQRQVLHEHVCLAGGDHYFGTVDEVGLGVGQNLVEKIYLVVCQFTADEVRHHSQAGTALQEIRHRFQVGGGDRRGGERRRVLVDAQCKQCCFKRRNGDGPPFYFLHQNGCRCPVLPDVGYRRFYFLQAFGMVIVHYHLDSFFAHQLKKVTQARGMLSVDDD